MRSRRQSEHDCPDDDCIVCLPPNRARQTRVLYMSGNTKRNRKEMNLEGAVALLEKQVSITPTCRLHQMLGDLLGRLNEEAKAFDHYHTALGLEPNNQRALEGMNRLDGVGVEEVEMHHITMFLMLIRLLLTTHILQIMKIVLNFLLEILV
ncbi:uncharacterized protein LOC142323202 [Lycorma delicatula]|uniref:uncharacterized protein LOC142323202 n=1 Tax=Lycorma delicatula TaxID=130591 RepID=UPI003F518534